MKIATNGARHWGSQLPRIEDGFRTLGHEITPHVGEADLVYSNNDHAGLVLDRHRGGVFKPGAKLIFTCLDVPEHLFPHFDLGVLRRQLLAADAVCTISQFGQWQVKQYLGLDSTVVYQPIKRVERAARPGRDYLFRFAHVGRRTDSNKRFGLAAAALQILGYTGRDLALIGNEPGWGNYIGVLRDEDLNEIYNNVDFVFALGLVEGLSLTPLEAMACGVVPIVCRDMTTRAELLPPDLFPEYEAVQPDPASIARFIATYMNDESGLRLANLKGRLHDHYQRTWATRVSSVGVAQRILDVYATLS